MSLKSNMFMKFLQKGGSLYSEHDMMFKNWQSIKSRKIPRLRDGSVNMYRTRTYTSCN